MTSFTTQRLHARLRVVCVWLVSTLLVLPAPGAAQDYAANSPVLIVDPLATITFNGNGWGHGVGMSQWGTRGRAEAGHNVQEILDFYYPGTRIADNYNYPISPAATQTPNPTTAPNPDNTNSRPPTTSPQDDTRVLLATTTSTVLTPEGFNRITIDNHNTPSNNQPTRAPANTPISFSRASGAWHISFNGNEVCAGGCIGQSAQLHFATDTAVAISTTGRSYSHGRIHLVAAANDPNSFHITLDSLSVEKFLGDQHNVIPPNPQNPQPPETISVVLAQTAQTTLTPQGLNRITLDDQNITVNGVAEARAPFGSNITVSRSNGWNIQFNNTNLCGEGCDDVATVQLHFATGTSVAVSNTGRAYTHGRINLIADNNSTTGFTITLDSLTIPKFFDDPQGYVPAAAGDLPTRPSELDITTPPPRYPEDAIGIHLATTTQTTLIPHGTNRITVNNQGSLTVIPNTATTFTFHGDHWHIINNGIDICGAGCFGNSVQLHFATGTSVVVSNTGRSYAHGRINLVPTAASSTEFYVVLDRLTLEEYLRGIAEIPTNWPAVTQDVQAIAARSYAVASLRERRSASSWNRPFDLYATVQDQAYVGNTREQALMAAPWLDAVERTKGKTLFYENNPVKAFYSSSNGGHSERSGYVFAQDLPYLVAKPDPFDSHTDNPNSSWTHQYSIADFNRWLNDHPDTTVGRLISMEVIDGLGSSGRTNKANIKITGTDKTVVVTGTRLNNRLYTAAGQAKQPRPLSTKFTFTLPAANVEAANVDTTSPTENSQDSTSPTSPGTQNNSDSQLAATYYSGIITGPDFCTQRSLGGPLTYPHDTDKDGIADICSLRSTKREEAARQRALDKFELAAPAVYRFLLAEECLGLLSESFGEPDKEPHDQCARFHNPNLRANSQATNVNDANAAASANPELYFSGPVITSPEFCTSFSLGGPITYPHDTNKDGIADICSLKSTRRVAVARQQVLARLTATNAAENWATLFLELFAVSCNELGGGFDEAAKESVDECASYGTTSS